MCRPIVAVIAAIILTLGQSAAAQQPSVLTLNLDQLIEGSGLNARVSARIARLSEELAVENTRIQDELIAEELALTEQRPTLEPEAFRELADAFDAKVQRLREEQDAKAAELQRLQEEERQSIVLQIMPVIEKIVEERGASLVIDRRAAIWSSSAIDITDEAVVRVRDMLAQSPNPGLVPAPDPSPETIETDP